MLAETNIPQFKFYSSVTLMCIEANCFLHGHKLTTAYETRLKINYYSSAGHDGQSTTMPLLALFLHEGDTSIRNTEKVSQKVGCAYTPGTVWCHDLSIAMPNE